MRTTTIIHKLLCESMELKDCYGALRRNDILSEKMAEAIQILDVAIEELKSHPNTVKEIEGL